ncbi:LOW QUALITY PROTEIN: uncharacterized protein Dere_GG22611, partial [Drosophila erecta]
MHRSTEAQSQTSPDEGGPPLPPVNSPENVEENMKTAKEAPVSPKSRNSKLQLRVSRRTSSRETKCEELESQSSSSSYVGTRRRGRPPKQKRTLYGELTVNCRKCGTATIYYPARTKFFSCAEIDGRLFKVKRISARKVLGGATRKEPKKRTAYTCRKPIVP